VLVPGDRREDAVLCLHLCAPSLRNLRLVALAGAPRGACGGGEQRAAPPAHHGVVGRRPAVVGSVLCSTWRCGVLLAPGVVLRGGPQVVLQLQPTDRGPCRGHLWRVCRRQQGAPE
ncbi:unnamed protein product, partial [Symbiodinium sp. KB8]